MSSLLQDAAEIPREWELAPAPALGNRLGYQLVGTGVVAPELRSLVERQRVGREFPRQRCEHEVADLAHLRRIVRRIQPVIARWRRPIVVVARAARAR
ncbi:MAG: hypothetical protein KatS3mg063_1524 [Tepidiforma sp.]|nr:MAG: hypothetical protein KatS3mg063_1524 [Tepidiforma sp.]